MFDIVLGLTAFLITFGGLWLITRILGELSFTDSTVRGDNVPHCPKCNSGERVIGHSPLLSLKNPKKWHCGRCNYAF